LYVGGNINSSGATDFVVTGGQQSGATDFPAVNFSYYQGIADHVVSGNKTFAAGTYSGIWYINGNVTINSNVTINGSIISTGNVDVKKVSNVTITASSPYPALVANGNFNFEESDNITVSGLIFVGADLSGNFLMQKAEDITFTGTVIVAGNFNVQNTDDVSITYNDAIIDNPPPGFTSTTGAPTTSDWQEVI
jgi:hypothetical protein